MFERGLGELKKASLERCGGTSQVRVRWAACVT